MTIPTAARYWAKFPLTYRAREMEILAQWIASGESGSVVGLPGVGRGTFLGFLCHRPDALQSYLPPYAGPVTLIPLDLNNLPDHRPATLYRIILRSFYETAASQDEPMQQTIADIYRRAENARDPFVAQSAVRELLLSFQAQETQVVLVINRFDRFCRLATPQMISTLRGLRDSFRSILSYLMGMRQEVAYVSEQQTIGPLYGILDTRVCRVGPLNEADGRHMIGRETRHLPQPLSEHEIAHLLALTGGYPSLIRVACYWRMSPQYEAKSNWLNTLLEHPSIYHRLGALWAGLTQEEKEVLGRLRQMQRSRGAAMGTSLEQGRISNLQSPVSKERGRFIDQQDQSVLAQLAAKGVCERQGGRWTITGDLLAAYIGRRQPDERGRIWLDEVTGELYQGKMVVENLQPLERAVLDFLLLHPYSRHYYTELIEAAWPGDVNRQGVSNDALFQVIRGIRKQIEPDTDRPRYLINFRDNPEGGYRFFPEGQPG